MTGSRRMKFAASFVFLVSSTASACGPSGLESREGFPSPAGGTSGAPAGGVSGGAAKGDGGFSFEPGLMDRPDAGAGPEACAAQTIVGERIPLDVFVLLDQSGSMTETEDRWGPVTAAILGFVDDPVSRDIGVGLQYFPLGAQKREDPIICEASTYEAPDVPIATLPGAAATLRSSIEAHAFGAAEADTAPHWGTPTRPAVEGVLRYLRAWQTDHPDHRTVLLLATDGLPSRFCAKNRIDDIAALLAEAAAGPRGIFTYVIGIGNIESLQTLAEAGGTGKPAFVASGAGGETLRKEFLAALQAIRSAAIPCALRIPEGAGMLDLDKVNVEFQRADAPGELVPRVSGAEACKPGMAAWHFDRAAAPTSLVMCPAACERLAAPDVRVDVIIGCKTVVVL